MISYTYIIKDLKDYENKRNTYIDRKLRVLTRSYTIKNLSVDFNKKSLFFNRTLVNEEDKSIYYGYFSEKIINDEMHLEITIRNMIPKNYEHSLKISFPNLHKFVSHKEEPLSLVPITSLEEFDWTCNNGHVYTMKVSERVKREFSGDDCPTCNSLENKYPHIISKFDYKLNDLSPSEIRYNSNKLYWWKCDRCNSSSQYKIQKVESDTQVCNKCKASGSSMIERRVFFYISYVFGQSVKNGHRLKKILGRKTVDIFVPDYNLAIEYDGVFWHKKKIKQDIDKTLNLESNGIRLIRIRERGLPKIRTTDIVHDYKKKEQGFVDMMNDVFSSIKNYVKFTDKQEDKLKELEKEEFSEKMVPKDFYYYPLKSDSLGKLNTVISKEWSNNNSITPFQVKPKSTYVALWDCGDCGHEYPLKVYKRVNSHSNPCPKCKIGKNSFEHHYPELSKYWSKKNPIPPSVVLHSSGGSDKFKFDCKDCGCEYESKLSRLRNLNYSICPNCYDGLIKKYGLPKYNNSKSVFKQNALSTNVIKRLKLETDEAELTFLEMYETYKENNNLNNFILTEDMIDSENIIKYEFKGETFYDFSTLKILTGIPSTNLHRIIKSKGFNILEYKNFKLYPEYVLEELRNSQTSKLHIRNSSFGSKSTISKTKDKLFIKKDLIEIKKDIVRADIEIANLLTSGSESDAKRIKEIISKMQDSLKEIENKVAHTPMTNPWKSKKASTKKQYTPSYPSGTKLSGRWSVKDSEFLKNNYTKIGAEECAKLLCRDVDKVVINAYRMGVPIAPEDMHFVTAHNKSIVKTKKVDTPLLKIKKKGRKHASGVVNKRATKKEVDLTTRAKNANNNYMPSYPTGTTVQGEWIKDDEDFLILNYPTKGRKYCAELLCRKESSVQKKINLLGLTKINKTKRKKTTDKSVSNSKPQLSLF